MARKSIPVGDLTWMDRAQLHTDLLKSPAETGKGPR